MSVVNLIVDVNTEANIMKDIVVKMLESGEPVFFGCDVMKFEDRYDGILDLDLFDYNVRSPVIIVSLSLTPPQFRSLSISPST